MCFIILKDAGVERGSAFEVDLSAFKNLKTQNYCVQISSKPDE